MTLSNAQAQSAKCFLMNNLESKQSLVTKLATLCIIITENFLSKYSTKKWPENQFLAFPYFKILYEKVP